jgi:uncharacterized protein
MNNHEDSMMPNDLSLDFRTLTEIREAREDQGRNPSLNPTMGDVINYRFSRRSVLTGSLERFPII